MAYNQHIGIYANRDEFTQAISGNKLAEPWVAYIGTPGEPNYEIIYSDDIKLSGSEGDNSVNVFDTVKSLLPVFCTEDEYEVLINKGNGPVTDISGNTTVVSFDPNVFYYTYDPSDLNEE